MPTNLVPTRLFLTRGNGVHREKLQSFELALRDAGIAALNLVSVSSIYPPGCKTISRRRGEEELEPGQIAMTGSLTLPYWANRGEKLQARIDGLGAVNAVFD